MILTETFIVENVELLTEKRGGKNTRVLRGIFGRCDEKNNNGRVYSKPLLEREVTRIAESMTERRLLGELDHPSHDSVKLSNVSHLITNLSFKGNDLVGECELLDTPSSRGMGTLSEQADGTKTVNEDFRLVTFDLVADPSTRGAYPGISESNQSSLVEEIVSDTLDKAAKEKVFTTMLKSKLKEKLEIGTFDMNQAPANLLTVPELQKKANKKVKPGKDADPLKNWEDFYTYNTGKPRKQTTRGYDDAETVTSNPEVSENKYSVLRDLLTESTESAPINEFSVIANILEAKKKTDSTKTSARKALYAAAEGAGKTRRKKINKDSKKANDSAVLAKEIKGLTGWSRVDHDEDPGQGATSPTAHRRRTRGVRGRDPR